jgi:HK97 family phage major capsid protein
MSLGRTKLRDAAYAAIWSIQPDKLEAVLEFLDMRAAGHTMSKAELRARGFSGMQAKPFAIGAEEQGKQIAVLTLRGTIAHHAGWEMQASGGTSTVAFGQAFDAAMNNTNVGAIVIDCDSGGGTVEGVAELFAKVFAARGKGKEIIAVANAHMHSAAFWICAAADQIVITPSGQIGNIGVMTVRTDYSAAEAEAGVKRTIIKAGEYKGEGAPFEPMTDDERAATQAKVDTIYGMFAADVAKGRGDTIANVKAGYGEGRSLTAREAVKAGLADRIATLEQVLAEFGAQSPTAKGPRSMTSLKAETPGEVVCPDCGTTMQEQDGEMVCPECDESETDAHAAMVQLAASALASGIAASSGTGTSINASAAVPPTPITNQPTAIKQEFTVTEQEKADALKALREAETERINAIRALCADHAMSLKADEFISKGMTVDAVRAAILDEKKTITAANRPKISTTTIVEKVQARHEQDPARGYRTPTEFMLAVMNNSDAADQSQIDDERLRPLATRTDKGDKVIGSNLMAFVMPNALVPQRFQATVGSDEQGNYSDKYGGFLRTETTMPGLLQTSFEGDPTDGKTQAVPMQSPTVKFNVRVDKDHSTSVSGGFTFTRKPETVAATSSRGSFEQVTLQATTLTGLAYGSDEVMIDSPISFAQIIADGFSQQLGFHLFSEKMRGLGGSEFSGVLTNTTVNPALISVAKESNQLADTLVTANCSKMVARCWGYDNAIWLANHTLIPQLSTLSVGVGTAGALVWMTDVTKGFPATLFGRPIYFTELCSAVGDAGDIALLNMSQYLEGTYQPVQSASSVHVRWVQGETAFKTWLRNAAAPWWRSALTPKYGDTRSPFVTLDAR